MEVEIKASWLLILVCLCSRGLSASNSPLNVCSANITESSNGSLVLLYTRVAATNNDTCMHFVWSTRGTRGNISSGYPTLFSAQTDNEGDACTSDCSNFLDNSTHSVNIPQAVDSYFSIGVVFTRLVEFLVDSEKAQSIDRFNDTLVCHCEHAADSGADNGTCEHYSTNYTSTYLNDSHINWDYNTKDKRFVGVFIDPESGNETDTRMFIKPHFPSTEADDQRLDYFPNTLYTANSTTMDIVIKQFAYTLYNTSDKETTVYSRIAMELFVIHGNYSANGTIWSNISLDDEYTPSVFTTVTYEMLDEDTEDDLRGFIQWKPISYQSVARKSTESQQVNFKYTGGNMDCDTDVLPQGLAAALFGGGNASNVTRWFAVFGTPEDDTYLGSEQFSTWTGMVGFGKVPLDTISTVVIVTIIVGLGVPAALVLLGAVYVFIKKKPWQNVKRMVNKAKGTKAGYTKLN